MELISNADTEDAWGQAIWGKAEPPLKFILSSDIHEAKQTVVRSDTGGGQVVCEICCGSSIGIAKHRGVVEYSATIHHLRVGS